MRRRSSLLRALLALAAALCLSACSGGVWQQRVETPVGDDITYDEKVFRDIEHVIDVCATPLTLQPGQTRLNGSDTLLADCKTGRAIDFARIERGSANPAGARAAATIISVINAELPQPIPSRLLSVETTQQAQLLTWLIPMFQRQVDGMDDLPGYARDAIMQVARSLLGAAGCTFRTNVDVTLNALNFTSIHLSWERGERGARVLRLAADLDAAQPQATANIATDLKCFGSNKNVANALLESMAPDGPHQVTLRGGHIVVDYGLSVRVNPQSHRGEIVAKANSVDFSLDGISIERFGKQPADAFLDQKIADLNLTAAGVAQKATTLLKRPFAAASPLLGNLLLAGLDLDQPQDTRRLTVVGVQVDTSGGEGAHTMRFATMRTDKVCFFRPGGHIGPDGRFIPGEGEWVCGNFPPPKQACTPIPGTKLCLPPPRLPGP
ncbi:hypothetical protein [Methylocella silvestris]|uniref:hypothetical protein n=1 Tax=Methylocella silvestris TaxID=199596 RepID=UPI0011AF9073|nr:hypothetical protein [Methylocella silvestris]